MVMLETQDKAIVAKRNLGIVDFDVSNQVERVLLFTLEEPAKHTPSLQRLFQLSISTKKKGLTRLRRWWCRRPETTRADVDTSDGS